MSKKNVWLKNKPKDYFKINKNKLILIKKVKSY